MTEFLFLIYIIIKHKHFTIHGKGNCMLVDKIWIILIKNRYTFFRFHYWIFFWSAMEMKFQTKVTEPRAGRSMPDSLLHSLNGRRTVFFSSLLGLLPNENPNLKKLCPTNVNIRYFSIGLGPGVVSVSWLSGATWGRCKNRWAVLAEWRMTDSNESLLRKGPQVFRGVKCCMTEARQ